MIRHGAWTCAVCCCLLGGCLMLAVVGCAAHDEPTNDDQLLALLLPQRIDIVESFTRPRSFDDDDTPDGIELLLQAVNALDDRGGRIVGQVHVELYEFVPASAEPRGTRLYDWTIDLSTIEQQRRYWNRATQMYRLRLAVSEFRGASENRFVLVVTHRDPLGRRLEDEMVVGMERGPRG